MANKLKIRFEVFKRDAFTCQYCGRTPPQVTLELDHIIAKSNGGLDRIENYITACFDCNRGKGAVPLDSIPQSFTDKRAEMEERREQLRQYSDFLESIENDMISSIEKVTTSYEVYFPGRTLSDNFKLNTVKRLLRSLPTIKVCEAMEMACSKFEHDGNGKEKALQYFCGICWNWIKKPEMRDW